MSEMTTRRERGASAPPALPRFAMTVVAAMCTVALADGQGQKSGSPEDNLPPNVTQLTGFGERASWSPDGRRIAFMSKKLRRRVRGRCRHEGDSPSDPLSERRVPARAVPAQWRFPPDRRAHVYGYQDDARSRDQEMWILEANGTRRPAGAARPQDLGRGRDFATHVEDRLVEHARPVPRSARRGRVGLYTADIVNDGGAPRLVNKKESNARESARVHARSAGLPQRRCRADLHLLPLAVCRRVRRRSRIREGHDLSQAAGEYNEVEGIFPDGEDALVESSRDQLQQNSSYIDIWKLKLEPDSKDFVRAHALGGVRGVQGLESRRQPGWQDDRVSVGTQSRSSGRRIWDLLVDTRLKAHGGPYSPPRSIGGDRMHRHTKGP